MRRSRVTPPTERHLSREELVLQIEGGTLEGAAVEHLLAGCSRCMKMFHGVLMDRLEAFDPFARTYLSDQPDEAWRRDSAVGALWGLGLFGEAEARRAPERLRELLELPASERRGRIRGRERFRSAALVDLLRERAREEGFRDPALSLELAELAVEVADSLKSEDVAPGAVADEVRALAWASLGNAQRVASDLFAAERSFRTALALPVLSPERRAEMLSLLGSLRNDQARYEEARGVLEEAVGLYRGMDASLEGKALIQLAHAFGEAGDAEAALPHLERAGELLGADDLLLRLFGDHYRIQMLVECGKADEADRRFRKLQPDYAGFRGDFGVEQRRKWLAARIAAARGASWRAETLLREIRDSFAERELGYDVALVSLDLAILLIGQDRHREVAELAREMVSLFASREIHGHALAALALFQQAAAAETLTLPFLRSLAAYFRAARRNPYLEFSPSP
jgi:tetratricopeptide (TPR) repeat protein